MYLVDYTKIFKKMATYLKIASGLIFIIFLALFLIQAGKNMSTIPFHDFDEAHRAENAKRMKEYYSFLVPLTGSPVDRTNDLRIPLRENNDLFLYYHPERPPLVYWLMIASTSTFDSAEWAYRLPSLVMALSTIGVYLVFSLLFQKRINFYAIFIGLLALITSADLWLSGQYAQMDTTLTFFLFLSVISLIYYCDTKKPFLLILSGLSFALAILGKGQPAVIFIFPLTYLLVSKKLPWKKFIRFVLYSMVIILPWFFLLEIYFGLGRVLKTFTEFAARSALVEYSHIEAPIFWYARWWFDSLRSGWILFMALFLIDLLGGQIGWKKKAILAYILGGFSFFSLSQNKIWWYVLPLVPAIAFYIYLSLTDYLAKNKDKLLNLSLAIFLAALPIFMASSNKITLAYGILMTTLVFIILKLLKFKTINLPSGSKETGFVIAAVASLSFFYQNFPKIIPYHYNTKFVAEYYKDLPGRKCLWIKDMPPETALFYSNAGEVLTLTENRSLFTNCMNYLITPTDVQADSLEYVDKGKELHLKDQPVLIQKGTMKLVKLGPSE